MGIRFLIVFIWLSLMVEGQIDTIRWEQLSSLPDSSQRIAGGYFLIDSDFYVAGGQVGNNYIEISSVWQYHIPTNKWIQKGYLPFGPASTECSFVINGKGYFLIARDSVSNNDCDRMFWRYDPAIDSWARMPDFPDSPRQNSSCFVYGGKGYVGQTDGCTDWDTRFWQYDPATNQWAQVATLPADIIAGSVAIATLPANAYLFGGYDHNGNFLKDIWRYNIHTNLWDSVGQMPGLGRCYSTFWGFDSVIIGGGGQTSDNNTILTLGSDFYLYNFSSNQWKPITFQNTFDSTGAGAAFVYMKKGYYLGGLNRLTPNMGFTNQFWSFDASKFFPPDSPNAIAEVKPDVSFSVFPNPLKNDQQLSISTSESGSISFSNELGQVIDERKLERGINHIMLPDIQGVLFYKATLQNGIIKTGKVIVY